MFRSTYILYTCSGLMLDIPLTLCMLPLLTGVSHSLGFQCGVNKVFTLLTINASLFGSWLPTFQDGLSVPYSRVKDCLTLEYGTDRLFRIVGNCLPINTAYNPRRAKFCHSVLPWSISLIVEILFYFCSTVNQTIFCKVYWYDDCENWTGKKMADAGFPNFTQPLGS